MLCLQFLPLLEDLLGFIGVDEVVSVSDSQGLVDNFYTPADTNIGAEDFYSADIFLRYGSSLKVVRVASADAYNATPGDTDEE